MSFAKVTHIGSEDVNWINMNKIFLMEAEEGSTFMYTSNDGGGYRVKETPEEILAQLKK